MLSWIWLRYKNGLYCSILWLLILLYFVTSCYLIFDAHCTKVMAMWRQPLLHTNLPRTNQQTNNLKLDRRCIIHSWNIIFYFRLNIYTYIFYWIVLYCSNSLLFELNPLMSLLRILIIYSVDVCTWTSALFMSKVNE